MTTEEQQEWNYRYQERLGILCGSGEPTPEQMALAKSEADQTIRELNENHSPISP